MRLEPFENAGNFQEDVGMFEAATHAPPVELTLPPLHAVHLALDGSNQDETARRLAAALAGTADARLHEQSGATTAAEILDALNRQPAGLVILPAPFGRDYGVLGDESLGSVVDMLLLESPCPVLCVRGELSADEARAALADPLVPVAVSDAGVPRALEWAFRIAAAGGQIELLAVADQDVLEEARRLIESSDEPAAFDPERISRTLFRDLGSVVAAGQKLATARNASLHVEERTGRFARVVADWANARPRLTIWAAPRDHAAPAFHRGVDLLLASTGPVLFVPK